MLRARIAVRLEKHQQALESTAARCFKRGANLRRVMPVIVNQRHAGKLALDLKTPSAPRERREALPNQVGWNVEDQPDSSSCGGIPHIVNAGRSWQVEHSQVLAAIFQAKCAGQPLELH